MTEFPMSESRFYIEGVCGKLQVTTMSPESAPQSLEDPGVVVVVCHPHPLMGGTMNNKVVHTVARCHRDKGRRVVRFNFRGVEKSEGKYAEGIGEADDLISVLSWVKSVRPVDVIVLAGFSFGSYVAARALQPALDQGFKIASLLLVAPAVVNCDFENYTAFSVPLSVIAGDSDEVVDPEEISRWYHSVSTEKRMEVLEGAGHFFHGQLTELKSLVGLLS